MPRRVVMWLALGAAVGALVVDVIRWWR